MTYINIPGNDGGGIPPNPPVYPKPPNKLPSPNNSKLGSNPGLLTSTGGLFGGNGVLLTPVLNSITNNSYILLMDPSNFNCEEDCEYDFPQQIPNVQSNPYQDGCIVNCNLIKLKYREIDKAQFTINITTYNRDTDEFTSYPFVVNIPSKPLSKKRKALFPDKRIHTLFIPIDVPGERPQPTINSKGGSGAYSIISMILCGNADETPQV